MQKQEITPAQELEEVKKMLQSYEQLLCDQVDDDSYVARGNGFCDSKYSEDFLQMRIAQLTARAAQLETNIGNNEKKTY